MEKAKQFIREVAPGIINSEVEMTPEERVDLKIKINTLLHTYLPGNTTVAESEVLAFCIHQMILEPKDFLNH